MGGLPRMPFQHGTAVWGALVSHGCTELRSCWCRPQTVQGQSRTSAQGLPAADLKLTAGYQASSSAAAISNWAWRSLGSANCIGEP